MSFFASQSTSVPLDFVQITKQAAESYFTLCLTYLNQSAWAWLSNFLYNLDTNSSIE